MVSSDRKARLKWFESLAMGSQRKSRSTPTCGSAGISCGLRLLKRCTPPSLWASISCNHFPFQFQNKHCKNNKTHPRRRRQPFQHFNQNGNYIIYVYDQGLELRLAYRSPRPTGLNAEATRHTGQTCHDWSGARSPNRACSTHSLRSVLLNNTGSPPSLSRLASRLSRGSRMNSHSRKMKFEENLARCPNQTRGRLARMGTTGSRRSHPAASSTPPPQRRW